MELDKVFVFGTLKEGFPNFHINKGRRFRGEFETNERFPLYLVGERYSPWLVVNQKAGHNVQGEVYSVTSDVLAEMDKLERVSEPDGYHKVIIQVRCNETDELIDVYAYGKTDEQLKNANVRKEIAGKYLLEHSDLYRSRNQ
ncbi:gamma-glutamylcyclotransferase family protein [Vibrio astriarenae]